MLKTIRDILSSQFRTFLYGSKLLLEHHQFYMANRLGLNILTIVQDMKILWTTALLALPLTLAFANTPTSIRGTISWKNSVTQRLEDSGRSITILRFDGAVYREHNPGLPHFSQTFHIQGYGKVEAYFTNMDFEPMDLSSSTWLDQISSEIPIATRVEQDGSEYFGTISFLPLRKVGSNIERLTSFEIRIIYKATDYPVKERGGNTFTSVLADGEIYKFAVNESGVHKLDYDFLKNKLGIAIDNIDPRTIKLFGNGGGVLPETVGTPRADDLIENAIEISGEADGKFNTGDFILFYAESSDRTVYDPGGSFYSRPRNFYDQKNYYFLKISPGNGLRIKNQASVPGSTYTSTSYDDFIHYEPENSNLLHDWAYGQGSGRQWFGDYFKVAVTKNYDEQYKVDNLIASAPVKFSAVLAARIQSGSFGRFTLTANGRTFSTSNFSTTFGGSTDNFASMQTLTGEFIPGSAQLQVRLDFIKGPESFNEGWLDYLTFNFKRQLVMVGNQMTFRDRQSLNAQISTFRLGNASSGTVIWDITEPLRPLRQTSAISGNELSFSVSTNNAVREFIAFNNNTGFKVAEAVGKIPNQNLHSTTEADLVIVYPKAFQVAAEKLAAHRKAHSNLKVALAETGQLYNEFSSGRKDVSAIRDFVKMVYDRSPNRLRYLLLLGDGSFDSRNLYKLGGDFVPIYETANSVSPIYAFPSDDYFALLSDDEGGNINYGLLDISVGRLPVKTAREAEDVVNKIIHYDSNPIGLRDWRNRVAFFGDDEDYNLHTGDADGIATALAAKNPNLNIDKIYLDAFPQEATPGGTRIPLATEALNNSMFKGLLAWIYLGHGGTKGLTQERVLKIEDILAWKNFDNMPLIITATCSFAAFDNPAFTSAGELALLNKKGGAIGLYSTVRPVFASSNERLTRASVDTLFYKLNKEVPTLGEVLRLSKNKTGDPSNSRKFLLIGDPSQKLALPNYRVITTGINNINVSSGTPDTIKALQKVNVEGEVRDDAGNLVTNFNGIIYPTVFDKKIRYRTLAQDPDSPPFDFDLQKNVIFKGRASVVNGKFKFSFVVPKDIDYKYGLSKISYYASDELKFEDASGNYQTLTVGGTYDQALADNKGPKVDVFINDENFVFGGITTSDPHLFVKLQDDNGINVVGNSIGHDLTGVLDDNTQNTYVLNDFYESALDDYTKGEIRYPLSKLSEGRHRIKVTAWDISNNSSEGYTEFVVVNSDEISLRHVLNFPNPFTTSTCFMFEHNKSGVELDILIQIYTLSGRLIKNLEQRIISEGNRLGNHNCLQWNGRDDFGDQLAKGVYLYKVKLRSANGNGQFLEGESDFQKLVILK